MPALVAPLVGFALGALLALGARRELEGYDEQQLAAARRVALLFAWLAFAPVVAYFEVFAADWSIAYLAEARAIPSAAALAWLVASAGAVSLGFAVALAAVRRRAPRGLVVAVAAPIAAAFIVVAALFPELSIDGTTAGVRGSFGARSLVGSVLGWAVVWMNALLAAGFVLAQRALVPPREVVAPAPAPKVDAPAAPTPASSDASRSDAESAPAPRPRLLGKRSRRGA
ncbi:MAG TPA: hypothetical protein VGM56_01000 [Byssovorax sp.]